MLRIPYYDQDGNPLPDTPESYVLARTNPANLAEPDPSPADGDLDGDVHDARTLDLAAALQLQGIRDAALSQKGMAAQDGVDGALDAVADLREALGGQAPTQRVRDMFDDVLDRRTDVLRNELKWHLAQEKPQARIDLSNQRQALAHADAISAITPLAFHTNVRTALDEIDNRAKLTGQPAEDVDAEKAQAISAIHGGRIGQRVANGDPAGATDWLNANRSALLPKDSANAQTLIDKIANRPDLDQDITEAGGDVADSPGTNRATYMPDLIGFGTGGKQDIARLYVERHDTPGAALWFDEHAGGGPEHKWNQDSAFDNIVPPASDAEFEALRNALRQDLAANPGLTNTAAFLAKMDDYAANSIVVEGRPPPQTEPDASTALLVPGGAYVAPEVATPVVQEAGAAVLPTAARAVPGLLARALLIAGRVVPVAGTIAALIIPTNDTDPHVQSGTLNGVRLQITQSPGAMPRIAAELNGKLIDLGQPVKYRGQYIFDPTPLSSRLGGPFPNTIVMNGDQMGLGIATRSKAERDIVADMLAQKRSPAEIQNALDAHRGGAEGAPPKVKPDYSVIPDPPNLTASTKPTPRMGREMKRLNTEANGGVLRDDVTGEIMVPSNKSQRGVTPPTNEVSVDHIVSVDKGGTRTTSNLQLRTRKNNRDKSNR